jgi:hypothetical protein
MSGHTIKSLLFEIIPTAAVEARGEYPAFSQRDLYYVCRDAYLNHPDRPFHREYLLKRQPRETDAQYEARRDQARGIRGPIDFKYFTGKVLKHYEREHGRIPDMIREAFGKFVPPHSGETVDLGTLEVEDYDLPEHVFDKILICEKRTERPKFTHDNVADRHDMAIVYSAGYATEALHDLLDDAQQGDYQIFCWHDADPDGYNIVRNIREETENMPISIEVIDLGLTVEQALDLGLAGEPFAEDRTLGHELRATLNDIELEYFEERRIRFEINAIPSEERIAYVERLLEENGARPKYVPPREYLEEMIGDDVEDELESGVEGIIERLVDKDAIVTRVTEALREEIALDIDGAEQHIRERFGQRPTTTWRSVVYAYHRDRVSEKSSEIEEIVSEEIVTTVTGDLEEGEE